MHACIVLAFTLYIVGRHTFPVGDACIWNDLPSDITSSPYSSKN